MSTFQLLINGTQRTTAKTFPVLNPATEEVVAQCPLAGEAELNEAVIAARKAQPGWAARPLAERRAVCNKLADLIEANADELATLLTQEQGKPTADAHGELGAATMFIRYFAGLDIPVKVIEDSASQRVEEHRKALGIVAGILPWNYPLLLAMWKITPAILAGNAFILKPAPTTPLSSLKMGELMKDVVPAGIVQVLSDNGVLGPLITAHPDIDKISFTGSAATGKAIVKSSAGTLKRITLELGGNDAAIILDDVDVKAIAPQLFTFAFPNCGQVCTSIKRLYVHDSIYDEMCDEFVALAEAMVVGNGADAGVQMGPVQNKMQFDKIMEVIAEIKAGAGTIIAGGERVGDKGYFIRPTVVRDVKEECSLVHVEAFGPVRPILRYTDLDDAIARANDSRYGLGGSVWSSNLERASEVARRMNSGTIWINKHMDLNPSIPFRGIKESGMGTELSIEGLYEFTSPQIVNMAKAS